MLENLNENPDDIEDIFFTGGLNSPSQTDLLFEFKNEIGQWKNYAPDFLIKKKNGTMLIVEIKKERLRDDSIEGEKGFKASALREIESLNKNKIKYEMLFTPSSDIGFENIKKVQSWMNSKEKNYGEEKES